MVYVTVALYHKKRRTEASAVYALVGRIMGKSMEESQESQARCLVLEENFPCFCCTTIHPCTCRLESYGSLFKSHTVFILHVHVC